MVGTSAHVGGSMFLDQPENGDGIEAADHDLLGA